jgi:hypothetical protein
MKATKRDEWLLIGQFTATWLLAGIVIACAETTIAQIVCLVLLLFSAILTVISLKKEKK